MKRFVSQSRSSTEIGTFKKLLTSGSDFAVNSLTSSTIRNPFALNLPLVFATPEGEFQQTSSIQYKNKNIIPVRARPNHNILDVGYSIPPQTYTINIPNSSVRVEAIPNLIDSNPDGDQLTSSVVYIKPSDGELQSNPDFFLEPVLSYEGTQSAEKNDNLQAILYPHDDFFTASLPFRVNPNLHPDGAEIGIFIIKNDSNTAFITPTNYIQWASASNGGFITAKRTSPVGMNITASYSIPFIYNSANNPND